MTAALSEGIDGAEVQAVAEPAGVDLTEEADCLVVGPAVDVGAANAVRRAFDGDGPAVVSVGRTQPELRPETVVKERAPERRLVAAVDGAVRASRREGDADGWLVLDSEGRIAARGGTATDWTDASDPLEQITPDDRGTFRSAVGRCLGTGDAAVTATVETVDGGDCVKFRFERVTDADGRPVRIHASIETQSLARCDGPTARAATGGD